VATIAASKAVRKTDGGVESATAVKDESFEFVVVSSAGVDWEWEGVVGNTGPVNGPGALRGLNPPSHIAVVGGTALWCLGYNERQPGCFVFNLSNPQVSVPVSSPNFERLYGFLAFDGNTAYLANTANTPEASNYYHLPETFVVGIDLNRRSTTSPQVRGCGEAIASAAIPWGVFR
jgi:hypothetical protein